MSQPVALGVRPVAQQDLSVLHPKHGPHHSVGGTPARAVPSVRRTSTVDTHRPHGLVGYTLQQGRARDLLTTEDGPIVLGEATIELEMEYEEGPTIVSASSTPPRAGLEQIVGLKASTGFRNKVIELVDVEPGTPAFMLLDEIPAATLVSGHALAHAARRGDLEFPTHKRGPRLQFVDLCAGFTADGTILTETDESGLPPVTTGPDAPAIVDPEDPIGWHALGELAADSMRRMRRMDVTRSDGLLMADVFFRDSHMEPGGHEVVIHEYGVTAAIDEATMTFVAAEARDHSLPWQECPRAAASAERLVGMPLEGLRATIRAEFVGPTTCTHLNDTMRSLEDVATLAHLLPH